VNATWHVVRGFHRGCLSGAGVHYGGRAGRRAASLFRRFPLLRGVEDVSEVVPRRLDINAEDIGFVDLERKRGLE
jgi:hypothetical protein